MSLFDPQNPGIGGLDELTDSEALTVQMISGLGDPGADRILFWDESANSYAFLTVGSGLSISGTTITATGGGGGGGDVSKVGTPVNNQIGVWTGDGTIEGDTALTFDTTTDTLAVGASGKFAFGSVTILDDTAGTTTLSNIDVLDATTESTIESAIDTLANLTSIQGRTVTLADAGADAILGWDDSANAYENLTQAEVLAVIGDSSSTAKGVVELATDAETVTGTDTVRATTPANITARLAAPGTIGGTTPGAITGTTITANTGFVPSANDGAYLGQSGTAFSDLFLASGGVINWNAGNISLTHSAGLLTLSDQNPGATGPTFEIYQDSVSPAASDVVGTLMFSGRDSAANKQNYAQQLVTITDTTSTSEDATITWGVVVAGTMTNEMVLSNTALTPFASGGLTLGASSLPWSSLFLAALGVVNFGAGDVTITHGTNVLTFAGATTNGYQFSDGPIRPTTNDGIALGTSTVSFADLFLASGGVINFANGNATLTHSTGLLTSNVPLSLGTSNALTAGTIELGAASDTTISRSSAGVIAVEGVVIPSISSTNTLTNKRITKRTGTTTSSATPTINTDNVDFYSITAQTVDITSFTTNLSGTPTEGQTLWIAITGTAARAITWGSSFEASTVALPTTTVSTNRLDVGFVYNTVSAKWRCIAVA